MRVREPVCSSPPPCFSVKPPNFWSLGRCVPKLQVTPACRSAFCSSEVFFFTLVFQRKRVVPFSEVRVFPISQRSSEGKCSLLSLGASVSTGIEDVRFGCAHLSALKVFV